MNYCYLNFEFVQKIIYLNKIIMKHKRETLLTQLYIHENNL